MNNLNLIIRIAGRDALPVRAIPYVTGWVVSPDVVARDFASCVGAPFVRLKNLVAYQLHNDEPIEVLPKEWDRYEAKFLGFEADLKSQFANDDQGYAAWLESAVSKLPSGVFVWFDEFERAFKKGFSPTRAMLLYEPEIALEKDCSPEQSVRWQKFANLTNSKGALSRWKQRPPGRSRKRVRSGSHATPGAAVTGSNCGRWSRWSTRKSGRREIWYRPASPENRTSAILAFYHGQSRLVTPMVAIWACSKSNVFG